jgi:hypothetical protein
VVVSVIAGISIMAIATIPRSTAHLHQISLCVDRFADGSAREHYGPGNDLGFNLVLDGIGDFINGLVGVTAGTNYGENDSLSAIFLVFTPAQVEAMAPAGAAADRRQARTPEYKKINNTRAGTLPRLLRLYSRGDGVCAAKCKQDPGPRPHPPARRWVEVTLHSPFT